MSDSPAAEEAVKAGDRSVAVSTEEQRRENYEGNASGWATELAALARTLET